MSNAKDIKYHGRILQVAVPCPLRRVFDYLPPVDYSEAPLQIQPGIRVLIPFGNRQVIGILTKVLSGSRLSKNKLKPVISVLDSEPLFTPAIFKILSWGANYYQHPIGEVFATALPSKLRSGNSLKADIIGWKVSTSISDSDRESLGRAYKQKALLEFIEAAEEGKGSATNDGCLAAGFSQQLLAQLHKKHFIERQTYAVSKSKPFNPIVVTADKVPDLNDEQCVAVAAVIDKLSGFCCFLLDGVTGSGKTEVYMRVMHEQLSIGKQCLVLVPEIGLTPQITARFAKRFACSVVSLHSGLSDTERLSSWDRARDGNAGIIIGTRSAIFTPMANPGLIIVDEEHDNSFKQQDGFRYSARDLAVMRAREENICVILGSATPSLESLHNARQKKFEYLQLTTRAGTANPPTMEVVDISNESLVEGFSAQLLYKIQQHLVANNQVLVFINRRGFAPILNCQSCGWISECENCVAQLTVHANPPSMRCHHCGTIRQLSKFCPECKSKDLTTIGIGTQKVERFLRERFSSTEVLRIDRDSTRSKFKFTEMLQKIERGEPCILVGTQMLAKGHHFPNITLVAILDADAGLFSADFRGQEQMAQTIIQVAGRAGRAERAGEVIIQSRHSTHAALQRLINAPYSEFANLLLAERKTAAMPPYSYLCLIRAEAADLASAHSFLIRAATITDEMCEVQELPVERLGPLPAPMEKRNRRFRVHLLLKSSNRGALQDLLRQLCGRMETLKHPRALRWGIDVDPQDLI